MLFCLSSLSYVNGINKVMIMIIIIMMNTTHLLQVEQFAVQLYSTLKVHKVV